MDQPAEPFVPAETLEIYDLNTLKIMADPLRMQIVDVLRRDAATVKEMAAELHLPPKSLYYHVNLLQQHGLIRVVDTRLVSGIVEKRYRATAYLFAFADLVAPPGLTGGQREIDMISSVLAITRDEIRISIESGIIDPAEHASPERGLHFGWSLIDLSPVQVEELCRRLGQVFDEFQSVPGAAPGTGTYRVLTAVFPTYRRGKRPDVPTRETNHRKEP